MIYKSAQDYSLITIYGDSDDGFIAKSIQSVILDRDLRILTPGEKNTLMQAASNSSLVLIAIESDIDPALKLAADLRADRSIAADIVACCSNNVNLKPIEIMAKGFSCCMNKETTKSKHYKKYLTHKINAGNRRLSSVIQEEEYRRMSDALSCAPASMIIFDANKRAVFVSDHYYRAYPKIATRLIRGLSVYDAFELMMKEEGIPVGDERHAQLQKFWHNLEGRIEFKLDSGTVYSLKAVPLPNNRGTVVVGQNVTMYRSDNDDFNPVSNGKDEGRITHLLQDVVADLYDPLQSLMTLMVDLEYDAKDPGKLKFGLDDARKHLEHIEKLYEKIETGLED